MPTMRIKYLYPVLSVVLALLLGVIFAQPAAAQSERIAAVVNEDVISTSDLNGRLDLALTALNLPSDNDTRQRLLPRVVNDLVNEQLQIQEARRLNIEISPEDIENAFKAIAQQNGLTPEAFKQQLRGQGITVGILFDQLRAQIAWSRVIQRTIRQEVEVTEEDIAAVQERLEANANQPEYLIAEIFLPIDNPSEEGQVRRLADRLVDQIRGGANFQAIARQFSQSAGAARGGDVGWIGEDQLSRPVREVVSRMSKQSLSPPIRDVSGYRIVLLRDRRNPSAGNAIVNLRQIFLPREQGSGGLPREAARELQQAVRGCDAMQEVIKSSENPMSGNIGDVKLSDLPGKVQEALQASGVGELSPPIERRDGLLMFMVCKRKELPSELPSANEIANDLAMERMEILQRRYIRDLRAAAFIDIRVSG